MGLIEKIKSFFSNKIEFKGVEDGGFIYPYSQKNGVIKIGANIEIPENYNFVITNKNKVLDILNPGSFQISALSIPNTFKALKLFKNDKRNRPITKFKSESYFVKLANIEEQSITNYRKLTFKEEKTKFNVNFVVNFNFSFANINKFLSTILKHNGKLRKDDGIHFIKMILTENLTEKIFSSSLDKETFVSQEKMTQYFNELVENILGKIGLKLTNLTANVSITEKKIKKIKDKEQIIKSETKTKIEIDSREKTNEVAMYEDELTTIKKLNVSIESQPQIKNSKEFVDLSLDKLYDDKSSKICPTCGANNLKSAAYCYKCRNKL